MFKREDTNFFVIKYSIDEKIAGVKNVSLYAEINDNPEFPEDGAFMLDIYLAIEPIAFRDHVVGLIFGNKGMAKDEMDSFVDSIVAGQLDDTFHLLVKQMLHTCELMEQNPFIP